MRASLIHDKAALPDPLDAMLYAVRPFFGGPHPTYARTPYFLDAFLLRTIGDDDLLGKTKLPDYGCNLIIQHPGFDVFPRDVNHPPGVIVIPPYQGRGVVDIPEVQPNPELFPRRFFG